MRRKSKEVRIGNISVGGNNPIAVQSMTKTDTRNAKATIKQIHELEKIGCEIIRVAVPDMKAACTLHEIKKAINIPLVADIHFNYKLAIKAIECGVDKIRINPGNIGKQENVKEIVRLANERNIPIRIGINIGSLEKRYQEVLADRSSKGADKSFRADRSPKRAKAMVASAMDHIKLLEDMHFFNIIISIKSSDVISTIEAYRQLAKLVDYPLHLGITEAGTLSAGTVKSAVGIGVLLSDGIGDTIRVSLTAHPSQEIKVAYQILKSLGLRNNGVEIVSCPSCGRCEIDQIALATEIEKKIWHINKPIKVAVMGCVVNGPGEAKDADIGVAGGKKVGLIYKNGKILKKVKQEEIVPVLIEEINKLK